jgi:hypothetical protein
MGFDLTCFPVTGQAEKKAQRWMTEFRVE